MRILSSRTRATRTDDASSTGSNPENKDHATPPPLFLDETEATTSAAPFTGKATTATEFDDKTLNKNSSSASFGDVVGIKKPAAKTSTTYSLTTTSTSPSSAPVGVSPAVLEEKRIAARQRRKNAAVAIASIALAVTSYLWQWTHPLQPIQLLVEMQQQSAPLEIIGRNDKPTVVDFWAPWCEECKKSAPTLRQVELEYKDRVNFVMVNGDLTSSWPTIEAFGVDAIPHLALVSASGDVETALIGPVPKHVLAQDLDVLLHNAAIPQCCVGGAAPATAAQLPQELPHRMLDAFAGKPSRRVSFGGAEDAPAAAAAAAAQAAVQ